MLKKYGKHGSVSDTKAVGRRWTNAVAIRTPVPKCWDMNINLPAIVSAEARLDMRGNPQADNILATDRSVRVGSVPMTLNTKISTRARTCAEVL